MTRIRRLCRIDLVSADPDRLAAFYGALGFSRSAPSQRGGETRLGLRLGEERVDLVRPPLPGAPYPVAVPGWNPRFQHFAIVVSDMREAYALLQAQGGWTAISNDGPVRLPETTGGVTAFKFRDPEGHPLELIAFPVAQPHGADMFRGIDHSAISVADTKRSIEFYGELGLVRTGGSLNEGIEQAWLDDIAAPVVEVTALSPTEPTPHLELLCYRGNFTRDASRLYPSDIAATRLIFGETAPVMIQDPDGHMIVVDEA